MEISAKYSVSNDASSACGIWQTTHEYRSHGVTYCRYVWGRGHEVIGYRHIKGGCTTDVLVQARRAEVERWITIGRRHDDILNLIATWPGAKRGRKRKET